MWYNAGDPHREPAMPHTLTVTLSDPAFDGLRQAADSAGAQPAEWLAAAVADMFPAPGQGDVRKFFGTLTGTGKPGLTNEQIDAILADEYGSNHEPE